MPVFKRYKGKKIAKGSPDYAKGTWCIEKRLNGRLIKKALPGVTSRVEAERIEAKIVADNVTRRFGMPSNITFAEFADTVYLKYVHQKNANTYVKELFVTTLKKFFGRKRLADITPQDCRDFQHIRLHTPTKNGGKRAAGSVNKETSTLSIMFRLACEQGLLPDSPMRWVKKLPEAEPRRRTLTDEQKQKLWIELEKDVLLLRLVTLAANLPLRRAQILAITPDAINLQTGALMCTQSKGRPPRPVPLNDSVCSTFRLMLADDQLPLPISDFRKRWRRVLVAAGINKEGGSREDNFHFHDLRHIFGTELLKRGANPYHIKDLFAHSSMEISAIYISSEFEQLRDTVRLLDPQEMGGIN
jgi:integrase/recombinase XerD